MPRPTRKQEVYELRCSTCCCVVEVPTHTAQKNLAHCPKCGARLEIRWNEAVAQ